MFNISTIIHELCKIIFKFIHFYLSNRSILYKKRNKNKSNQKESKIRKKILQDVLVKNKHTEKENKKIKKSIHNVAVNKDNMLCNQWIIRLLKYNAVIIRTESPGDGTCMFHSFARGLQDLSKFYPKIYGNKWNNINGMKLKNHHASLIELSDFIIIPDKPMLSRINIDNDGIIRTIEEKKKYIDYLFDSVYSSLDIYFLGGPEYTIIATKIKKINLDVINILNKLKILIKNNYNSIEILVKIFKFIFEKNNKFQEIRCLTEKDIFILVNIYNTLYFILGKVKDIIRSREYWGDNMDLIKLQRLTDVNVILFNQQIPTINGNTMYNYDKNRYSILLEYNDTHYNSILYNNNGTYQQAFNKLPSCIEYMIHEDCRKLL